MNSPPSSLPFTHSAPDTLTTLFFLEQNMMLPPQDLCICCALCLGHSHKPPPSSFHLLTHSDVSTNATSAEQPAKSLTRSGSPHCRFAQQPSDLTKAGVMAACSFPCLQHPALGLLHSELKLKRPMCKSQSRGPSTTNYYSELVSSSVEL